MLRVTGSGLIFQKYSLFSYPDVFTRRYPEALQNRPESARMSTRIIERTRKLPGRGLRAF